MSTLTASIFIGQAHQNHGGINPTHLLLLSENSRPTLILKDLMAKQSDLLFIPTLENMIDDIYLIICAFVLKNITLPQIKDDNNGFVFYDEMSGEERYKRYIECKVLLKKVNLKVVFNILDGCHLTNKVDKVKEYPTDFEITLTKQKKEFNVWIDKTE